MKIVEVPSPINLQDPTDAMVWANEANIKRPWRYDFFNYYVNYINNLNPVQYPNIRVLEIGSGPGFLAKAILQACPRVDYVALDFSETMHILSKNTLLDNELSRVTYLLKDFKTEDWHQQFAKFDVVIIHQALHELRHKAYAHKFHQQVRQLLHDDSTYFVCDHLIYENNHLNPHFNNQLFMSKDEHYKNFNDTGFSRIETALEIKGLCLFKVQP